MSTTNDFKNNTFLLPLHEAGLNRGGPPTQIMRGNFRGRAGFRSGHVFSEIHCSALTHLQKQYGEKQDDNLRKLIEAL